MESYRSTFKHLLNSLSHLWICIISCDGVDFLKVIVGRQVTQYKKVYDNPKTPYQRLMNSEHIPIDIKEKLKQQHEQLNPFHLTQCIESKLKQIFKLVSVTPSVKKRL